MRLSYKRCDRLSELIQVEVSDILLRKIKDPRVGRVTITGVEVSADLRTAKIYFTVLGETEKGPEAMAGLKSAAGFIRKMLGSRLELRYVPDIEFHYDHSFEYGQRIDKLLQKIEKDYGDN